MSGLQEEAEPRRRRRTREPMRAADTPAVNQEANPGANPAQFSHL